VLLQSGTEQLQLAKMTANNAVVNNRQLHVDERVLARNLAAKSGGKFTVEQIENALRNSGNTAKGEGVDEGMVVRTEEERYDKGAVFNAGEQGSGAIVQELPNQGQVNADLASFIVANTGGSSSPYGWLDGQLGKAQPVSSNPNAGLNTFTPAANGCASAECAGGVAGVKNPVRDGSDIRNDVADGAAGVSRGSGIVGSTATAASAIPGPHQPGAVTTALVATGVGFTADVIEQIARPDVAISSENAFYMAIQMRVDSALPIAAPITNEVINAWKNSNTNLELKEWANIEWRKFIDSRDTP
jgi:filamentous hemagglutinin